MQSEQLRIRARRIIQEQAQLQRAANGKANPDQNNIDPNPHNLDPSDNSSTTSEDSFDDDIMSSLQPKGILKTMLGEEYMMPITSPTIINAQNLH